MAKKGVVAVLDRPGGKFELKEYPLPDPAPGTVLVKQELGGVCGTDIHMYHGRLPGITYPICLGHEFMGRIAALGKGVTTDFLGKPVKEGDRVIVVPGVGCGKCYWCQIAKTPTCCEEGFAYGFFSDGDKKYHFTGGFADHVYLHHPGTAILKTELPLEIAILAEPISVADHAVSRSNIHVGDTVVIQGSGAVGLTCQVLAKLAGATKIIHIGGPTSFRIDMAKEFGADITINVAEVQDAEERIKMVKDNTIKGMGADVVFECTGVPRAVREGLDMLRRSGTFVEVGHFTDGGEVSLNPFIHMCNKNVNLQGSWGGELEGFVRELPVLEKREFPFEKLITHKLPLRRLNDIMQVPDKGYIFDGRESLKITVSSELA
ncbi:zinc-binding dehydrogenase [Candidatus Aerophobetes bacterium]|nr:zinc-binding dehydrogenase [Candidatus Aerophobetes bacterium]